MAAQAACWRRPSQFNFAAFLAAHPKKLLAKSWQNATGYAAASVAALPRNALACTCSEEAPGHRRIQSDNQGIDESKHVGFIVGAPNPHQSTLCLVTPGSCDMASVSGMRQAAELRTFGAWPTFPARPATSTGWQSQTRPRRGAAPGWRRRPRGRTCMIVDSSR